MGEPQQAPPGSQGILLDIGGNIGALVVAAAEPLLGREIEVTPAAAGASRVHAVVHQRWAGGRPLFAAVFPALAQGDYELRQGGQTLGQVQITGGQVTEVALTTARNEQPLPGAQQPAGPWRGHAGLKSDMPRPGPARPTTGRRGPTTGAGP